MTNPNRRSARKTQLDALVLSEAGNPHLIRKHFKELEHAGKRLGGTDLEIAEWLVEFLNTDVEALPSPSLQMKEYEIAYFSIFGPMAGQIVSPFRLLKYDRSSSGWSTSVSERYTVPNRADLLRVQIVLRKLADELTEGRGSLPLPAGDLCIEALRFDLPGLLTVLCAHSMDSFIFNAARLLAIYAARLRHCEERIKCGRLFLSARRKQAFCSDRCQTRAAKRRQRLGKAADKGGEENGSERRTQQRHNTT